MNMNTSRVILLSVITALASLCVGVVLAQPNSTWTSFNTQSSITYVPSPSIRVTTNGTYIGGPIVVSPFIPANETKPVDVGGTTSVLPSIITYPYPILYSGPDYVVQYIVQLLMNANDGTYTGLTVSTQNGVTTIKANEVTVTSDSTSIHVIDFKCVIDKSTNTISVTASLIDYKEGATTFYGKDVSFSFPYGVAVYNSGGVVPTPLPK